MTDTAAHASAETMSSYLDRELDSAAARQLEDHLERCAICRDRYASLESVVTRLRRLETPALPATLDQAVARRIALHGDRPGLLDRFERTLASVPRQSSVFVLFAVVMALAVILYLFSLAVERSERSGVRVVFTEPPVESPTEAAPRTFRFENDLWIEEGVDADAVTRELTWESEEALALLAADPALAELRERGEGVILAAAGEVLLLRSGPPDL